MTTPSDEARAQHCAKAWAQLFPVKLEGARLTCNAGAVWEPRIGLLATVSLHDSETYRGPHGDLVIVGAGEIADADAVLTRVKAWIAELVSNPSSVKDALARPIAETLGLNAVAIDESLFDVATPEEEDRRRSALARANERFDAVSKRMREAYGLPLPKHVAVWAAFWESLSPLEQMGMSHIGRHPGGIMVWFEKDGLDRKTRDELDPRLHDRFRCDPPELVTVMWGDTDGLHYGLWYDDPQELPSFIASNYARDSAETSRDEPTVVSELLAQVTRRIDEPDYPEEPTPLCMYALLGALRWWENPDDDALDADEERRCADVKRGEILGGLGPALPENTGAARATYEEYRERADAYREHSSKIDTWIATAKSELARGEPAFALVLGRELHWLDDDAYRETSLELLIAAYEKLDRGALADIARVHHANRDLEMVGVYDGG